VLIDGDDLMTTDDMECFGVCYDDDDDYDESG
jgi:hypothetical protein